MARAPGPASWPVYHLGAAHGAEPSTTRWYGLDLATGAVRWHTNAGTPVRARSLPRGDITPAVGFTGTPGVHTSTGTPYAVAEVESAHGVAHELVAVDVATGGIRFAEQVDPAGMNAADRLPWGAENLSGGRVVVMFGGLYGVCGTFGAWVVAAPASGHAPILSARAPTAGRGGI